MDKTMEALSLIITLCIIASFSGAKPMATQPRVNESFTVNKTLQQLNEDSSCIYTVTIATSCGSPPYTNDLISLRFGDAFDNAVYVRELDDPSSGRFDQCSTDRLKVHGGPCIGQVCYVELLRIGSDGWMVETVTVSGYKAVPVTFHYHDFIAEGVWDGLDYC